jgi:uncharacterized protein YjbI with pentapeptide repeats
MKSGSVVRPSIPEELTATTLGPDELFDDACFTDLALAGAEPVYAVAANVQFLASRITKVSLAESELSRFDAADVEFHDCNLSNVRFTDASFRRVLLSQCKLTGVQTKASNFSDVEFRNCRLEFASFEKAKFNRVTFRGCRLRDAAFFDASFENVRFADCDFVGATFTRVRAKNSEMRRSLLTGVRGLGELRGIAMERGDILANAELFAAALGILVLTEPDDSSG